jgi:hypothetical protein
MRTKFLIYLNKCLGKYGQNAFCSKRDVKELIFPLLSKYKDSPIMKNKLNELLENVEDLPLAKDIF